jgi:hypothetical protein
MAFRRWSGLLGLVLLVGCDGRFLVQGEPPFQIDIATFPFDAGIGEPQDPPPAFGPTVTQAVPPPAISGGTLLVLKDGKTAVAADPDRDRIFVADLTLGVKTGEVVLTPGDEPGRVAEDGAGLVHVALRRGGALIDLDPRTATVLARRPVCAAPRGVVWDAGSDQLHVACAGGELVSLPAAGGDPVRTLQLDRDLRDVVVAGSQLVVSRFRSAEVLIVESDGRVSARTTPPRFQAKEVRFGATFVPAVAWRMIPLQGGVAIIHQRAQEDEVEPLPGGYGSVGFGQCPSGIVHSTVAVMAAGGAMQIGGLIGGATLAVDLAVDPAAGRYVAVAAGNAHNPGVRQLFTGALASGENCPDNDRFFRGRSLRDPVGQAVAVAVDAQGEVVVQTREPASLQLVSGRTVSIALSDVSREDTGHSLFHANSGKRLACANCHPEGGEDGRVWEFLGLGSRRTQSLRGGILATAPFHWNGDEADLPALVDDVFVGRMGGPPVSADRVAALSGWLDRQPLLPRGAPADPDAVSRGEAIFNDNTGAGCAVCHFGPKLGSNESRDVGTGGMFQVPSLRGLSARAPYLHDGCASTLDERFGACGGGDYHGMTSNLTGQQKADLIAFLDTL